MKRILLCIIAVMLPASYAEAGGCVRTYQTTKSLHGWGYSSCWTAGCHQKPANRTWKEIVAEIALEQKRFEGKYADDKNFFDSMQALGLDLSSKAPNYSNQGGGQYGSNYQRSYNQYGTPSAQQGSTVTGQTTITTTVNPLTTLDVGAVFNMASRHIDQGQQMAQNGMLGFQGLIGTAAAGLVEAEKITRAGIASERALLATRPTPTSTTTTSTTAFQITPGQLGEQQEQFNTRVSSTAQGVLTARCVACHNPAKPTKDLDLSDITKLSPDQRGNVLKRIISPDPMTRMPLAAGGTPGIPLTAEETSAVFRDKEFSP